MYCVVYLKSAESINLMLSVLITVIMRLIIIKGAGEKFHR